MNSSRDSLAGFKNRLRDSSNENMLNCQDYVNYEVIGEQNHFGEKSKSDSVVRNQISSNEPFASIMSSTPRKQGPKNLKLNHRSSNSSSPTSVTSQIPSSPSPYSSMNGLTAEAYKMATQAYRYEANLNQRILTHSTSSNTASISSTTSSGSSSSSVNNANNINSSLNNTHTNIGSVNLPINYRSTVLVKRFNSPTSCDLMDIEANELFNKYESEIVTTSATTKATTSFTTPTKVAQIKPKTPGTPSSVSKNLLNGLNSGTTLTNTANTNTSQILNSTTIQSPVKTNEIWLEYGCI